jgi:cytochrome c5
MKSLPLLPIAAALLAAAALAVPGTARGTPMARAADGPGRSGEQVVQYQCVLCHGPGLSGAPKIGDGRAWGARASAGIDNLVRSATRGRGAMPPSGGLADLSEAELRGAIAYMLRRSGVAATD